MRNDALPHAHESLCCQSLHGHRLSTPYEVIDCETDRNIDVVPHYWQANRMQAARMWVCQAACQPSASSRAAHVRPVSGGKGLFGR